MADGVLITESLKVGACLDAVSLRVNRIERVAPEDITEHQRALGIPPTWTLLHFTVDDADAPELANALSSILEPIGWYADFHTESEMFVVFAERAFRYDTDDALGRAEAERYARARGLPDSQLDWP